MAASVIRIDSVHEAAAKATESIPMSLSASKQGGFIASSTTNGRGRARFFPDHQYLIKNPIRPPTILNKLARNSNITYGNNKAIAKRTKTSRSE